MNKQVFLDSNFILRFLLRDHEDHYQKAVIQIKKVQAIDGIMIIPHFILAEVIYVFEKVYQMDRVEFIPLLVDLLKSNHVVCENTSAVIEALDAYQRLNYDFADILLFSLANSEDSLVISFDKDLDKIKRMFHHAS